MYEVSSEGKVIESFVYKFSNRISPLIECMRKMCIKKFITILTRINKKESKKYLEIVHRA